MPRFFIHLRNGDKDCQVDEEGTELPDMRAARALAIKSAGEIIADEFGCGIETVSLTFFIDRKDGEPLVTIPVTASVQR